MFPPGKGRGRRGRGRRPGEGKTCVTTYVRQTLAHFLEVLGLVLHLHLLEQLLLVGRQRGRVEEAVAQRGRVRKTYGGRGGRRRGSLELVRRDGRRLGRRRHDQARGLGML